MQKPELQSMCLDLQLHNIQSMLKDTIIHSISDTIIGINYNTASFVLVLIDKEEKDNY